MESSLSECLCYKLQYLTRSLMQRLNKEIMPNGVTQGQLPVLCTLIKSEGITQSDLCEEIQVEQPTMANTLKRMERDGLICRKPCEHDKRQSLIFMTEQTRPTVELLMKKRDELLAHMTSTMTLEEVESFHRLLDKAVMTLQTDSNAESNTDK